ncbi:MAG: DNA internalization-related competence protein ComEC/Rec2 [Clostridiales bacterium]|nr:DNA internalization-related competence protein ComEC/Rec2 [Clostridiales bacterium]
MQRILFWAFMFYSMGLIFGAALRPFSYIFLISSIFLLILSIAYYIKGKRTFYLLYLLVLSLGMFYYPYKLNNLNRLHDRFKGKDAMLYGQISDEVSIKDRLKKYILHVDRIEIGNVIYRCKSEVQVIDFRNTKSYVTPYEYIKIDGTFEEYQPYKNIGMDNYSDYLLRHGVFGTFTANYSKDINPEKCSKRFLEQIAYRIKERAESRLMPVLDKESYGMMKGVLFGDTEGYDRDDYEAFKKCGIAHIFAVSGYNIWLIYFILSNVLFFLGNNSRLKSYIIIFFLMLYTVMTGLTPSVMRAFVMASIIIAGKLMNKHADSLTSLSLSGFIILTVNPLLIMDIGFILSFISAASIILILPRMEKIKMPIHGKIKDVFLVTLSVQIGILPAITYYFNNLPLLSIPANMIIMPVVSVFTVSGIVFLVFNFAFMGAYVNFIAHMILWFTRFINTIPYSNLNTISPNILEIMLYYIFVLCAFKIIIIKKEYRKVLYYALSIVFAMSIIYDSIPGKLKISFIDVGQGDSILIMTPDRKEILIDGGGKPVSEYSSIDIGNEVIMPFLLKHGINRIDMVISTHSDYDHLGGLYAVMKNFPVGYFVKSDMGSVDGYADIFEKCPVKQSKIINIKTGDEISAGKYVKFFALSPSKKQYDENDSSIVLKLVYRNFSALFTGDISDKIESGLLKEDIHADVLKVPHHGSKTSSSQAFLDKINPKAAVISVGENSFGHPSPVVLKRLTDKKVELFRTDKQGEVDITTNGNSFNIRTAVAH